MDTPSFDPGSVGEAQEWAQPWRPSAPKRLRPAREQLELLESVRRPLRELARSVARGGMSADIDDLHQIGMEHALRLLPEYQPTRGATFLTFVFWRARAAMKDSQRAAERDRACAAAGARGTRGARDFLEPREVSRESPRARRERRSMEWCALAAAAMVGC